MAEINASFIPKKDIKKRRGPRGVTVNVFLLLAVVIFLTSIAASLFVYWQKGKLQADNAASLATLKQHRDDYGIDSIKEYIELSNRLNAAEQILNSHISVEKIFSILEQDTLTDVVISNFSFETEPGALVSISARGQAPSFQHVATQADVYGDNEDITDLILSDVDQSLDGGVDFNIAFTVPYSRLLVK